jgi:hypothetical protein
MSPRATHYAHKIKIPGYASKFSAWFSGDPFGSTSSLAVLIDAERIDSRGRSYPASPAVRAILTRGGWSAGQVGTFNGESE